MRTLRSWLALCCSVALVVTMAVRVGAQVAPGNPFGTDGFVDASGGAGGSARGGDGGAGGSGTAPVCNQSTNDLFETDWWEADPEPIVACGAGGLGGDAGKAGESVGGNGGIAFGVGRPPPPTTPAAPRNPFADLFLGPIRFGSFIFDVGNNGPDTATAATFVATLSSNDRFAIFDSISTTKGACTGPNGGASLAPSQTFTCQLGDVAPGEIVTIEIKWHNENEVSVTTSASASVSSPFPPDTNPSNSSQSASETRKPEFAP